MPTKLYVGNLPYSVTKEDLEALFARLGRVESSAIVTDKFSGQSKGFGFVEMSEAAAAAQAVQNLNESEFQGRRIKVAEAHSKEPRAGGGGRRFGEEGGGGFGGRGNRRW